MSMLKRAQVARQAGNVGRYHTQSLLKPENVAQHTFNALNLLLILTNGQVSQQLVQALLTHDMGEYVTGDIPSPAKRRLDAESRDAINNLEEESMRAIHPELAIALTAYEHKLLKLADNLDGLLKCIEERRLGNRSMDICYENYKSYLLSTGPHGPIADEFIQEAMEEWKKYDS